MNDKAQDNLKEDLEKIEQRILPKVAKRFPFTVEVEPGIDYYYCTCGLSESQVFDYQISFVQPFCDGESCQDCNFKPLVFQVPRKGKILMCACKRNHPDNKYKCDGSHATENLDW